MDPNDNNGSAPVADDSAPVADDNNGSAPVADDSAPVADDNNGGNQGQAPSMGGDVPAENSDEAPVVTPAEEAPKEEEAA